MVGVDFLFWYAFGFESRRQPSRMEGLELGLKQLEGIQAPLIIGDLPDVRHALKGSSALRGGEPIISPRQMPSEEERAAMNARIVEWASTRKNVVILPLAGLMHEMIAGKSMTLHGQEWTVTQLSDALQKDFLHPNLRGNMWVALHVAHCATQFSGVEVGDFDWSEKEAKAELIKELEPEIAKQKARNEKLAKRKAAREKAAAEEKAKGQVPEEAAQDRR